LECVSGAVCYTYKPQVTEANVVAAAITPLMVLFLFTWLRGFSAPSGTSSWEEKALARQTLLVIFLVHLLFKW
jgi:hypothetical protein